MASIRWLGAAVAIALVAPPAHADDAASSPAASAEDSGQWQRIAGFTGLGVGAAALGLAAIFGLQARSQTEQLDTFYRAGGTWDEQRADLERSVHANNARAISLAVVGGVVAAAGGVLCYLSTRKRAERVTVVPSERGAAVVWAGSF